MITSKLTPHPTLGRALQIDGAVFLDEKNNWVEDYFGYGEELACRCCGTLNVRESFYVKLNKMRQLLGAPMKINSGYRCEFHNREVKRSPTSAHLRGAADIHCTDSELRYKLLKAAYEVGFTRIGVYKTFIHVDDDSSLPSPRTWYGE